MDGRRQSGARLSTLETFINILSSIASDGHPPEFLDAAANGFALSYLKSLLGLPANTNAEADELIASMPRILDALTSLIVRDQFTWKPHIDVIFDPAGRVWSDHCEIFKKLRQSPCSAPAFAALINRLAQPSPALQHFETCLALLPGFPDSRSSASAAFGRFLSDADRVLQHDPKVLLKLFFAC
jgi:hypothetical protein